MGNKKNVKVYVTDTSVLIEKAVSKLIKEKKIDGRIIIPNAVVSELENQANHGQEIGFLGLEEIQELRNLKIDLEFKGDRPNEHQIKYAKSGEIDAYIREIAVQEKAILITADKVQAESGKAYGLEVIHLHLRIPKEKLSFEKYFDEHTMSIHIKENCVVKGKKGKPGQWDLVHLTKDKMKADEIESIAKEVFEKSRVESNAFIEISRKGSTIIQYKDYRIVIVRPPVADGWEMTIVRPIKTLNLNEYNLSNEILDRIKNKARGIIVAGEVGSGKSTLAQAIAEYYVGMGKVTKTIESPRDLKLSDDITQYSKNFADSEEIHDILFLSRPDNIIFDEVRDTPDFQLYIDLRLAGSNVLGVLHSASPIDAVQRFIRRMDTGMIPSVLDTIFFIEKGRISKAYSLKMIVKVPTGMTEADLARPVVEVRDFTTDKLEYEIYSYGEETVVIPVNEQTFKRTGASNLAEKQIENMIGRYTKECKAEIVNDHKAIVYVLEHDIPKLIGTKGKNISDIEKRLGISIDIKAL